MVSSLFLNHPDVVVSALPMWQRIEADYAEAKYGAELNPQSTIMQSGLEPGGLAHQEFYRYFSAWRIFAENSNSEKTLLLHASQAASKVLSATRATICFALKFRDATSLSESNNNAIGLVSGSLRNLKDIPIIAKPNFENFNIEVLDPALSGLAKSASKQDVEAIITGSLAFFNKQAQFTAGYIASHGFMATPGYPSGDVFEWQV